MTKVRFKCASVDECENHFEVAIGLTKVEILIPEIDMDLLFSADDSAAMSITGICTYCQRRTEVILPLGNERASAIYALHPNTDTTTSNYT